MDVCMRACDMSYFGSIESGSSPAVFLWEWLHIGWTNFVMHTHFNRWNFVTHCLHEFPVNRSIVLNLLPDFWMYEVKSSLNNVVLFFQWYSEIRRFFCTLQNTCSTCIFLCFWKKKKKRIVLKFTAKTTSSTCMANHVYRNCLGLSKC